MQYLDIAAAFVTTFLGVLLAFGLENARQRRRTNHWVRQPITQLGERVKAVRGPLDDLVLAIDAWVPRRI
jgi:hypothetical protein